MRLKAYTWLLVLFVLVCLQDTASRKLDTKLDDDADTAGSDGENKLAQKEEEVEDSGGFGFSFTTFSPLSFLFGSDENAENEGVAENSKEEDEGRETTNPEVQIDVEDEDEDDGGAEEQDDGSPSPAVAEKGGDELKTQDEEESNDEEAQETDEQLNKVRNADDTSDGLQLGEEDAVGEKQREEEDEGMDETKEKEEELDLPEKEEKEEKGKDERKEKEWLDLPQEGETTDQERAHGKDAEGETGDNLSGTPPGGTENNDTVLPIIKTLFVHTVPAKIQPTEKQSVMSPAADDGSENEDVDASSEIPNHRDQGLNTTNHILVKSLLPSNLPKLHRHSKHHHGLRTNALPEMDSLASGKAGYSGKRTVGDNSSMLADRTYGFYHSMPMMDDLQRYMKTCDNCLVQWDSYQCPMNDMALELKKWMTELQDLLSFGCQNGENCARDAKCCHRRDPAMERAMSEMTELAKQMYGTFQDSCNNCPRDGGWSEWCKWDSCSVTCGTGQRTRSRECNNPTPKNGGRQCEGSADEAQPCSGSDCCTDGNWAPWSSWGLCSATCGTGMQDRMRTCSSPPPNYCGRTCPGSASDMRNCDSNIPCCVDGNWSPWGSWSPCPVSCGMGTVERFRSCSQPSPNYCGQPCPGSNCDMRSCDTGRDCCVPRDGNWSPWEPWSRCSVTCGPGTRDRSRTCNSPPPNQCGRPCPGQPRDTERCDAGDCCVDGNWGQWERWSQCSATCGLGLRDRRRRCDSPPTNYCGRPCPGRDMETESCDSQTQCLPVCVDGNWGQWQPWSTCSATCGSGIQSRMRRCDSPSPNFCGQRCPGSASETQRCDSGRVVQDGNWSPWESWSRCSATCGLGSRDRSRTCSNPPPNECGRTCSGPSRDTERCVEGDCCVPRDGNWSPWQPWSSCSATCGPGTRDRARTCSSPPPNECGRTCPGSSRDTDRCDQGTCCVPRDGNWSPWELWSSCSATCGPGTRDRSRTCSSPPPNECGRTCPGSPRETGRCSESDCCIPLDGRWSSWSPWSQCSATCGPGSRDRSRTCSNPPPNECGRTCPGSLRDTDRCDGGPCCVDGNWGPWEPWSQVTVTCGVGQRDRRRRCDSPAANYCGRPCPGRDTETEQYDTTRRCEVCVDGNWVPWGSWGDCSVTCGSGMQLRERTCSNPSPNYCGSTCPGPSSDTRRCYEGECCVDGNWGPWRPWNQCSESCGSGFRDRRRQCDSPPPNSCGNTCPGLEREEERCNEQPCPIICVPQDGNWSPWQPWSRCSATCGPGSRDRARTCSNPPPNGCGRTCTGLSRDTDRCDEGPCCVDGNWGPWEPWSQVTVTCGMGQRDRRRRCDSPAANYCGRPCPGREIETEQYDTTRPCEVCVDGNWGAWETWGACSATCGTGQQLRVRRCDNPPANRCGRSCPGPAVDSRACDQGPCCVDGNWSPWGSWSRVAVSCGVGQRDRRRRCDSPAANYCGRPCPGRDTETEQYDTRVQCEVCIDGNWGLWEPWSQVTVTCGVGQRDRRRRCDRPPANYCGQTCPGRDVEVEQYDTRTPCIVCEDGNWGAWEPWGACSATCGTGQQLRVRRCDNPPANICGRSCPGPTTDSRACDQGPCCADRQWSSWSSWSLCDVTCGRGTRTRDRTCQLVGFGRDCGNICPGLSTERNDCPGLPDCGPVCGAWSQCSATCAGIGTRQRLCTYSAQPGSIGGSRTETERCQVYAPQCPEPPQWGPWENWCPCGCKDGRRSRRRTCVRRSSLGLEETVDIGLCGGGVAREEEYCDVRQACPLCVTDCTGRVNGDYASCTSCNDYVQCTNGQMQLFSCTTGGFVWDAFIRKCVKPPSPSCSLVECVSSCAGLADGRYPSCFGCNMYIECQKERDTEATCPDGQEFNAHSGLCDPGVSPTCVRAITRTIDLILQDAPADSYLSVDDMERTEFQELYLELRKKEGVAAKYSREDEDVFKDADDEDAGKATKNSDHALTEGGEDENGEDSQLNEKSRMVNESENMTDKEKKKKKKPKSDARTILVTSKGHPCHMDCSEVEPGRYHSCKGCDFYLVCTKHGIARHAPCPRHKFWDDKRKKCMKHSRTCKHRGGAAASP